MMQRAVLILFVFVYLFLHLGNLEAVSEDEDRVPAVARNMETAFKRVEDYTCEMEQIFYRDGTEDQR